jgi:hypothetical protein
MKIFIFKLFAVVTLLTLLWMPVLGLADDNKVYPGSACVPESSSLYAEGGIGTALGTIVNLTGETIAVNCPIIRDNTTNTNGVRNVTVRVFIPPQHFNLIQQGNTGCTVFSLDGFVDSAPGGVVTLAYPNVGQLSLEFSGEHRVTVSFPLGQYFLRCALPSGAAIVSYLVIEFD